tara:strand:- start:3731 stop:4159 length:429 start_codon:yes stop_codon:yes gene_type:complete
MLERTLAIIKPDGVRSRIIGEIIRCYEQGGLTPIAIRSTQLTKEQAKDFYQVHRDQPFFDDLTSFMSSGLIVVLALEGEGAILRHRDLMGATDPSKAAEGTIRKAFGSSIDCNVVHGSDALETAGKEIEFFFSDDDLYSQIE